MRAPSVASRWLALTALALAALLLAPAAPAAAAPQNDGFADAAVIPGLPYLVAVDTTGATGEPIDEPCGEPVGTVWYSLSLPADTPVRVRTNGSDYRAILAVYTGTPGSAGFDRVACDSSDQRDDFTQLTFSAVAGQAYHIMVGSTSGSGGLLRLTVNDARLPFGLDLHPQVDAQLNRRAGEVTLSGALSCPRAEFILLGASLSQRSGKKTVQGSASTWVECYGTTSWSLTIQAASGRFKARQADVSVYASGYDMDYSEDVSRGFTASVTLKSSKR